MPYVNKLITRVVRLRFALVAYDLIIETGIFFDFLKFLFSKLGIMFPCRVTLSIHVIFKQVILFNLPQV